MQIVVESKFCVCYFVGVIFSQELKKWRGDRMQKEVNDIFGVPLKTYQSWEQGERKPKDLTMAEIKSRMYSEPDMARVDYFAKKFFSHLLPQHGRKAVIEILKAQKL